MDERRFEGGFSGLAVVWESEISIKGRRIRYRLRSMNGRCFVRGFRGFS